MTKKEREEREYRNLYCDEKHAKKAWKALIGTALSSSAKCLSPQYDKFENQTRESEIEHLAYKSVKERLENDGISREPMNAELIVEAAIIRARFQDTTFNTILERTAGKVKDELTVNTNPYENYSDEELEKFREYLNKDK